jgi:hypothetical protein
MMIVKIKTRSLKSTTQKYSIFEKPLDFVSGLAYFEFSSAIMFPSITFS